MESVLATWSSPINGLVLDDSISSTLPSTSSYLFPTSSSVIPSPSRSPTLYDYGSSNGIGNVLPKETKMGSTRSRMAENLLRDIELGRESQYPQSDFLNEDYVNLELFEDLNSTFVLGDTPPLSPELSYVDEQVYLSPIPSPLVSAEEVPEETFNQLNAEFQKILDSLPESSFHVDEDAMDLIENIMDINEMADEENGDDARSVSSAGDEDGSGSPQVKDEEQGQAMEIEYYITGDVSSSEPEQDPEDIQADVSVKILDALLDGNLAAANSYLPKANKPTVTTYQPIQIITLVPTTQAADLPVPVASTSQAASSSKSTSSKKAPKTNQKKPRLPPRVDRAQRKKEQNKTAATRYREKKKILATIITQQEEELSAENARLTEKKNDLARQISIVKQLLRDVLDVKIKNQKKIGASTSR